VIVANVTISDLWNVVSRFKSSDILGRFVHKVHFTLTPNNGSYDEQVCERDVHSNFRPHSAMPNCNMGLVEVGVGLINSGWRYEGMTLRSSNRIIDGDRLKLISFRITSIEYRYWLKYLLPQLRQKDWLFEKRWMGISINRETAVSLMQQAKVFRIVCSRFNIQALQQTNINSFGKNLFGIIRSRKITGMRYWSLHFKRHDCFWIRAKKTFMGDVWEEIYLHPLWYLGAILIGSRTRSFLSFWLVKRKTLERS